MRRFLCAVSTIALLAGLLVQPGAAAAGGRSTPNLDFVLELQNGRLAPAPGIDLASLVAANATDAGRDVHFFVQFNRLPNAAARRALAARGLDVLTYVDGNTYIAAAPRSSLGSLRAMDSVRWAGAIPTQFKLSPRLARGQLGSWARTADGRAALAIQVHADETIATAREIVTRHGGQTVSVIPTARSVVALIDASAARRLADEDAVEYVAEVDLPLAPHNDGARVAANVTPLAAAPYNLTGTGVTGLVYDVGDIDPAHNDFAGRILQNDGAVAGDHATHVGGTFGGNGANSNGNDSAGNANNGTANQWAGMAPAVNIRSFSTTGGAAAFYDGNGGDLNADFTTAINGGIDLATMSLGNNVGGNFPCGQLGDYTNTAILIDNIVTGSINNQRLIYFESAGNERGRACVAGVVGATGFSSISSPATAKNSIAVGAINSDDNSMTNFSSWGPTDDGRLKPDIVGPGCQTPAVDTDFTGDGDTNDPQDDTGIFSPSFVDADNDGFFDAGETQNAYVTMCGTSMSTPASAGIGALVVEQWLRTRAARPMPHTMKALLIHTATDLGTAGPDYSNGHGAINAQAAVDLVRADDSADLINVDQVDNGQTDFYTFNSDGSSAPRVTLAWDDPAAARTSTTQLINDLDLRLTSPNGTAVQPFVLNAAQPANAATRGNDNLNVVEVALPGITQAGTWTVSVAGTNVPTGPQQYTVITPADAAANNQAPTADAGGPYTTDEGTDVVLNAGASTDPDGDPLTFEWDFDNDGAFDDATGATPTFDTVGQDASFFVRVRVTDNDGAFSIDGTTVTVDNVAPAVSAVTDAPKDEGSLLTVDATISDAGWLDTLTATIDFGDGGGAQPLAGLLENARPDATLTAAATHTYGDNGIYGVEICGSDDDTTTCRTFDVQIDNVAPNVSNDPAQDTAIDEGQSVSVNVRFDDHGWLDTYTSLIDWGTGLPDTTEPGALTVTTQGPPRDIGEVTATHAYGDNGLFTVKTSVTDDDAGTGSDQFDLTVNNLPPTATIDESDTTLINGVPTFIAHAGDPLDFEADSTDPGSDDLTVSWDWDDGTPAPDESRTYLVNPPVTDPLPSPTVQPRDITDLTVHAFNDACLYEITFASADDDGDDADDKANVIITGTALLTRSAGYWRHQYAGNGTIDFDAETLNCYLAITGYMSLVFDEETDASTIAKAFAVLSNTSGTPKQLFDRQALAAWLNFANGALDLDELVDTNRDRIPDTAFGDVIQTAEAVRLNPASTGAQIEAQKDILERINLRDRA